VLGIFNLLVTDAYTCCRVYSVSGVSCKYNLLVKIMREKMLAAAKTGGGFYVR